MPRGQKTLPFTTAQLCLCFLCLRRRTRPVFSCCMRWNAAQTARLPSAKAACIPCCTDLRHAADVRSCERQTEDGTHRFYRLTVRA